MGLLKTHGGAAGSRDSSTRSRSRRRRSAFLALGLWFLSIRRRSIAHLLLLLVLRPRHFDLGSLGVPTLAPPHLGLGANLRHEGSLPFGVELLHHARRTWGCEKNAEAAPSGGSDGLLYLLGAAGCALGVVEINQELGL